MRNAAYFYMALLVSLPPALRAGEEALFPRLTQMFYRAALSGADTDEAILESLPAIPESAPPAEGTETALFPRLRQAIHRAALPAAAPGASPKPLTAVTLPAPPARPVHAIPLPEMPAAAAPPPSLTQALLRMSLPGAPGPFLATALPPPPSLLPPVPAAAFSGLMPLDFFAGPVFSGLPAIGLPLAAGDLMLEGGFTAPVPGAGGAYPLISPQVALPAIGVTAEHAERMMSRLVLAGLMDGSLNPRSPEWRPHLAHLLERPETRDPDTVFSLLLAGCAGNADPARLALAQRWAREHEGGRFSGAVDLFAARYFFFLGNYPEAIRRARLTAEAHPGLAVKALLLNALAEAHAGNAKAASSVIRTILDTHPDSPEIPEIRYMEAWLALQALQTADAKKMLAAIIADYPNTPTAGKASNMLATLENR